MEKKLSIIFIGVVICGVVLSLVGMSLVSQAASEPLKVRKIVVFDENFVNEPTREALVKNFDGIVVKNLPLINGMAILLSPKVERALAQQAGVLRIDDDVVVYALGKPATPPGLDKNKDEEPQPLQQPSWGYTRIGAGEANINYKGTGIKVGIIDSGISVKHPDLTVVGGVNTINPRKSYDDDHGHGSHVAGIVAALDNNIGVIGVAPEAQLYAIKVLDRRASGFLSDVIEGLQWAIENHMQVVNMSLGTASDVQSYHDAIITVYNAGITIVAAAGNDGETDGKIYYPAKYPETIAVSATDNTDDLAYFSSYGEEVDLAAPGQAINSTWKGEDYHIGSGTSMATPHVAGTVALILADSNLKCDTDLDESCSPTEVKTRLEATAEWLIELTSDEQGLGLIDAEAAVSQ